MADVEKRVVDLEIRYTHLERQVSELSGVVFEQQRSIDALRRELIELKGRVLGDEGIAGAPEKPPHY